jgi:NADPH2:quinone reductase
MWDTYKIPGRPQPAAWARSHDARHARDGPVTGSVGQMRAVHITEFGGPDVMRLTDLPAPEPQDGSVLIDVHAAGINYADTHQTEDSYLAPQKLPMIPGGEVVGTARTGEHAGRRVVALLSGGGGYAEQALAAPEVTFPVADGVTDAQALALIVQGTTAWHLLRTFGRLSVGESVVVHSAAGGVGTIAVQLAKHWGAGRVVGTATGPEKAELARSLGADEVVDLSGAGTAEQVTELLRAANGGRRADIVLEMTGGHVFDGSFAALAALGRLVTFGMASRVPPSPVHPVALMGTSRTISGFWLVHALRIGGGLGPVLEELFSMINAGRLKPVLGGSYPLAEAARAHQDLLSRKTVGKLVLAVNDEEPRDAGPDAGGNEG